MRFVILAEFHSFPLCLCLSDVIVVTEHSDCASRKKIDLLKKKETEKLHHEFRKPMDFCNREIVEL